MAVILDVESPVHITEVVTLVLVVGKAFTVTVTEFVNTAHPLARALTVYWVVAAGLAITAEPVELLKEPAGVQE